MNSGPSEFVELIPAWLEMTRGLKVAVLAPEDLDDRVRLLRARLSDRKTLPSDFEASDENLTVVSRLCGVLLLEPVPSAFVLDEVSALLDLVGAMPWPENAFGEKAEILGQLAFIGWRHSRQLGMSGASETWVRTYSQAFAGPSTWRDCVELLAKKGPEKKE